MSAEHKKPMPQLDPLRTSRRTAAKVRYGSNHSLRRRLLSRLSQRDLQCAATHRGGVVHADVA